MSLPSSRIAPDLLALRFFAFRAIEVSHLDHAAPNWQPIRRRQRIKFVYTLRNAFSTRTTRGGRGGGGGGRPSCQDRERRRRGSPYRYLRGCSRLRAPKKVQVLHRKKRSGRDRCNKMRERVTARCVDRVCRYTYTCTHAFILCSAKTSNTVYAFAVQRDCTISLV